ncbi:MAG TPA: hypothetical protein VHZ09_00340 [Acidobacteriaceae bacterium]|jgi:hypothetical protein|nr:hypothetical protein [Acidobacteriaceae bacterium]
MAAIEFTEETRQQIDRIGAADIVVGIAGAVPPDDLRAHAEKILQDLGPAVASLRFVWTWPGAAPEVAASNGQAPEASALTLLPFSPPAGAGELWSEVSANQRAVLAVAASLNAKACIVLGSDLAALSAHAIQLFCYAILDRQCGLALPIYPAGKYDGLINTGILSPLSRTLYGKRIRFPLTFDFAVTGAMCARMASQEPGLHAADNSLLWPVTTAATQFPQLTIGQIYLNVHHQVAAAGLDLSAVLGQLVGSAFQQMEVLAPQWQRIRGSQAIPVWGNAPAEQGDGEPPDAQPMLDSFLLGSHNLDELWRLVLPPNTLLEVRRLTRLPLDQFHLPDELWASIIYDFALAHRLRTISRGHLLGALTPLYLGWVASYVRTVAPLTGAAVEQRLEQMARAWEEKKPYLLSRWRWPDRFNP